jgi:hypothetical protein
MNNGLERKIVDINVGDILSDNNIVTAKFKLETKDSVMFNLKGITVSDSHLVKYGDRWIRVCDHPHAELINDYDEKYLYCLNTSSKLIKICAYDNEEQIEFTDWDELVEDDIKYLEILHKYNNTFNNTSNTNEKYDFIHKYYDGGLSGNTQIKLFDNTIKKLSDIEVGDILYNAEKVYGIVEIDGRDLVNQYRYDLGDNNYIEGSPNINFCDSKIKFTSTLNYRHKSKLRENNESLLYHLLTDKKTFYIGKFKLFDYNASVDLLLDKNKGKLLSMKYV